MLIETANGTVLCRDRANFDQRVLEAPVFGAFAILPIVGAVSGFRALFGIDSRTNTGYGMFMIPVCLWLFCGMLQVCRLSLADWTITVSDTGVRFTLENSFTIAPLDRFVPANQIAFYLTPTWNPDKSALYLYDSHQRPLFLNPSISRAVAEPGQLRTAMERHGYINGWDQAPPVLRYPLFEPLAPGIPLRLRLNLFIPFLRYFPESLVHDLPTGTPPPYQTKNQWSIGMPLYPRLHPEDRRRIQRLVAAETAIWIIVALLIGFCIAVGGVLFHRTGGVNLNVYLPLAALSGVMALTLSRQANRLQGRIDKLREPPPRVQSHMLHDQDTGEQDGDDRGPTRNGDL